MPTLNLFNQAGEKISEVALNDAIFGITPNQQVLYDVVNAQRAALRQGTAKTKTRAEVRGGGKKPWRQKGTGRARAGSSRSPIWVGGGTVFGPVGNQNYKISQNKKEHNLALKSALTLKVKDGLKVIDSIKFEEGKTKAFVSFLEALKADSKTLVVVKAIDMDIFKASRNVGYARVVTADNVSVTDLLNVNHVIMSKEAVKEVEEALK